VGAAMAVVNDRREASIPVPYRTKPGAIPTAANLWS
jgi:hypothetical protein